MEESKIQYTTVQFGRQSCKYSVESFNDKTGYYFFIIILSGVRLSPLGTAAVIGLLYQPQKIDDADCGATDGMNIGRGNRST
jgi:hypothetical protein